MRAFEMMVILNAAVDEADVTACISQITENITAGGGTLKTQDRWGKRRFAYEINHQTEGYYFVLEFVTEAREMESLQRLLQLADNVVRPQKLSVYPTKEATKRGLLGDNSALTGVEEPKET